MERKPALQPPTSIQKEGDEGKATIHGPQEERGGIIQFEAMPAKAQHIHLDISSLERLKASLA